MLSASAALLCSLEGLALLGSGLGLGLGLGFGLGLGEMLNDGHLGLKVRARVSVRARGLVHK